jgi:anti-sigma regulatory factor (Ser/Thr protein kinase)
LNVTTPAPVVGRWDKSRLDQVVTNLVSNAIKYGDCKPIDVAVEGQKDRAVITIRDRGLGIAPHDHERIFGRFERAASSRHFGGIGLGLWIVKQIIDALGGTVAVESHPGKGSTFTVDCRCKQTGSCTRRPPARSDAFSRRPSSRASRSAPVQKLAISAAATAEAIAPAKQIRLNENMLALLVSFRFVVATRQTLGANVGPATTSA